MKEGLNFYNPERYDHDGNPVVADASATPTEEVNGSEVFNEVVTQEYPLEKTEVETDTSQPHFPDTREKATALAEKYQLPEKIVAHMLEYERAGKNLSNFCHHLSHQEKKPVLAINNARTAALLQIGFTHWLDNFQSEEQADLFLIELHQENMYEEAAQHLQEYIQQLRQCINGDLRSYIEEYSGSSTQREGLQTIDHLLQLEDPSSDIRLELSFSTATKSASKNLYRNFNVYVSDEDSEKSETHSYWDAENAMQSSKTEYLTNPDYGNMRDKIVTLLQSIYRSKDILRSIIFNQAERWIQTQRIPSFVYAINHFKLSGYGDWSAEINDWGEQKFGHTASQTDAIIVFADVHQTYNPNPYTLYDNSTRKRGGGIGNYLSESYATKAPQLLELGKAARVTDALEYPLATNSGGAVTAPYKRLLDQVNANHAKLLDLQVVFPSQARFNIEDRATELGDEERERRIGWWRTDQGRGGRGGRIETILFDPSSIMKETDEMRRRRDLVAELRHQPDWLESLRKTVPQESNYSYAAPDN